MFNFSKLFYYLQILIIYYSNKDLPIGNGNIDVKQLLIESISYFDSTVMRDAPNTTYKKNRCAYSDIKLNELVPHENCYHEQLSFVLKRWLPKNIIVQNQVTTYGNKSCDIQVKFDKNVYLLELCAHVPNDGSDKSFMVIISLYSRLTINM